jgi:hypothetical protein
MEKNFVTVLTAQNAAETTKTLLDTVQIPVWAKKLVEVGLQIDMPGLTTLEDVSAILEVESPDSQGWTAQQFVTDTIVPLTSGSVVMPARVHDVNLEVSGGARLQFSATFNRLLTINPSCRAFGKFVG